MFAPGRPHMGVEGKQFLPQKTRRTDFFFFWGGGEEEMWVRGIKDTPLGLDPWFPGSGQIM